MATQGPPDQNQVAQAMIDTAKQLATIYNTNAVNSYNLAVSNFNQNLPQLKVLGLPIPPAPVPPMLMVVDENAILRYELNLTPWVTPSPFFQYVQYVPIVTPPPDNHPSLKIEQAIPEYPGFFEVNGDGPSISVGTTFKDDLGHVYKKTVISYSPFAPNGQVTAWQQVL